MDLLIDISKGNIRIELRDKSKIIDKIDFCDMHNLTEKLLLEIDALLRRNKLSISDVVKARVSSDQSDSFTSTRIAKATADIITKMKGGKMGC
jgi:hypothetical protein